MQAYFNQEGAYLVRPSNSSQGLFTISVVYVILVHLNSSYKHAMSSLLSLFSLSLSLPPSLPSCQGSTLNFKINRDQSDGQYFVTPRRRYYTVKELLETHRKVPLKSKTKPGAKIYLVNPIPATAIPPATAQASNTLPPPWQEFFDTNYGRSYYHNPATGQTVWERPKADPPPQDMRGHRVRSMNRPLPVPNAGGGGGGGGGMVPPSSPRLDGKRSATMASRPLPLLPKNRSEMGGALPQLPPKEKSPGPNTSQRQSFPPPATRDSRPPPLPSKSDHPSLGPVPRLPPKDVDRPLPSLPPKNDTKGRAPPPLPSKDAPVPPLPAKDFPPLPPKDDRPPHREPQMNSHGPIPPPPQLSRHRQQRSLDNEVPVPPVPPLPSKDPPAPPPPPPIISAPTPSPGVPPPPPLPTVGGPPPPPPLPPSLPSIGSNQPRKTPQAPKPEPQTTGGRPFTANDLLKGKSLLRKREDPVDNPPPRSRGGMENVLSNAIDARRGAMALSDDEDSDIDEADEWDDDD